MTQPAAITVDIARDIPAFDALETEWTELFQRVPANPFLNYAWTRANFDLGGRNTSPFIITIRENGELLGVAPLRIESRWGLRVLDFIAHDRSDFLGFLCATTRGVEERLLHAIMEVGEEWDLVILRKLSAPFTQLHLEPHPVSCRWHLKRWTAAPFCAWTGDWNAFHSRGPSWLREMGPRSRRFIKRGGIAQRFTGPEAALRVNTVCRIEANSWKHKEGATRLQTSGSKALLRRAFVKMPDVLELWLAYVEGRAVAFAINLLVAGRLFLYQGSYEEQFRKSGAGSVLDYLAIARAAGEGVTEYDYLSGEEPYKFERTTELRIVHHLAGHARSLRGWLAYAILLAPRWNLRDHHTSRAVYYTARRFLRACIKRL